MKIKIFVAILSIMLLAGCIVQEPFDVSENSTANLTEKDTKEPVKEVTKEEKEVKKEEKKEEPEKEEEPKTEEVKDEKKEANKEPTQTTTPSNKDGLPVKEVVEGDLVSFPNLKATDPDGDPITYTFSSPLTEQGKWQTEVGDMGEYVITITASDGQNTASQEVIVKVLPKNQPPEIAIPERITVKEGEEIKLEPQVTDADEDNVTVKYFGWMSSSTKQTGYKDAGTHKVTIEATDGVSTTSKEITIEVADVNRAPELKDIPEVRITEGEKVEISPVANDPDGDTVTFSFGIPLDDSGRWQTQVGDAGEYTSKVTASDGTAKDSTNVQIIVESFNKAPTIEIVNQITVEEGETVTLEPVVTDKEGDEFTVTYSGWMTKNTKTTTYEDAGVHKVVIKAVDSNNNERTVEVTINVEDVNRPPEFGSGAFL